MSRSEKQRGFTIIEFMIASAVFSTILLVITGAILYMNRSYQRGLYASRTQATTSNLVDTVAQAVKFSPTDVMGGGDPENGGTGTYCIGNRQLLFVYGKQLGGDNPDTTTKHVVLSRPNTSTTCSDVEPIINSTPSGNPKELLGKGMRLVYLNVDDFSNPPLVTISAKVAYGEDDLFCNDNVPNTCDGSEKLNAEQLRSPDIRCRSGIGSEFCAISELSTNVYRRL